MFNPLTPVQMSIPVDQPEYPGLDPLYWIYQLTVGMPSSDNSSPVDFAFEAPPSLDYQSSMFKPDANNRATNVSPSVQFTPTSSGMVSANSFPFTNYGLSSASSFSSASFSSSASGSATGGSFSSVDALPAISRDFTRPSPTVTRRPATAHGALQSRSPFAGFMPGEGEKFQRVVRGVTISGEEKQAGNISETIDEATEGPKVIPSQANDVDPRFVPQIRRASEPKAGSMGQPPLPSTINTQHRGAPMMQSPHTYQNQVYATSSNGLPMTSAPANVTQFNMINSIPSNNSSMNTTQGNLQRQPVPAFNPNARPQTSDGIPSFPSQLNGVISLPSARSITGQINNYQPIPGPTPLGTPFQLREVDMKSIPQSSYMPFREARSASMSEYHQGPYPPSIAPNAFPGNRAYSIDSSSKRPAYLPPSTASSTSSQFAKTSLDSGHEDYDEGNEMTFVSLGGPAPKKRPRRRFDEIERLYGCGWQGCEKAYGTLNHLNAHVAMQKHGDKRLPAEFKDLRKAWRKRKRESQAAMANNQLMTGTSWNQARGSVGSTSSASSEDASRRIYGATSQSDFDRRDSSSSMVSSSSDVPQRYSAPYPHGANYGPGNGWTNTMPFSGNMGESRPTTSSSVASSVDERQSYMPTSGTANFSRPGMYNPNGNSNGMSMQYVQPGIPFPQHPQQIQNQAQAQGPVGMSQNRRPSAAALHMSLPPNQGLTSFRPADGDYQTPTQQNPHPNGSAYPNGYNSNGGAGSQQGRQGFPFLTSGVPGVSQSVNQGYPGQFAFNR